MIIKENDPRLTDEFLSTLVDVAKTIGWSRDHTEVTFFVREVFALAGKPMPDLTPYDNDA